MNTLTELHPRLIKLHTGQEGLRTQLQVKISVPTDADGDCIDMCASDETLDRYHEVIEAGGWLLDNYQKNPVIQNCHQYGDILFTIGKALITRVEGNALVQRWQFATGANPMAKVAFGMYQGGFLNASSVGFIPLEWINGTASSSASASPSRTYTRAELLEVSAVGIPANPNALALAIKSGAVEESDVRELAKMLQSLIAGNVSFQLPALSHRPADPAVSAAQLLRLTTATTLALRP